MADNNLNPEIIQAVNEALLNLSSSLNPVAEAERKAAQAKKEVSNALKDLSKEVKNNAIEFTKNTATMTGGTSKYANSVESASSALGSMASILGKGGLFGKAIGFAISGMGKLAAESLRQNDTLMKTYQDLGKFGANSSSSFKVMMDNFQRAGFTVETAGGFVSALQKAAPELALFGGTVGAGSKRLTEFFSHNLDATTKHMMRFGMTAEEMFDESAQYVASQSVIGAAKLKTDKQLNAEALQYMETLAEVSMLTGMQKDSLIAQQRAHETDARYQLHLRKLSMGTLEEQAEAAAKRDQLRYVEATAGKEMAEGLKSAWVNANRAVDGPGLKMLTTVGPNAFNNVVTAYKRAGEPVAAMGDVMKENVPEIQARINALSGAIAVGKNATKEFFDPLMALNSVVAGEAFDRQKLNDSMKGVMTKEANDRVGQNADRFIAERNLNKTLDNVVFSVGNLAVPAVTKFAEITNMAASATAKLVKAMTFGGVDFTKEFKDATDITKESKETWKDFEKTGKELSDLEEKKKKAIVGSAEEKKLTEQIAALKGTRKGLGEKLLSQDVERQRLGGSSIFSSQKTVEAIRSAIGAGPATAAGSATMGNAVTSSTIDELFSFSDSSAKERFSKLDGSLADRLVKAATEYKQTTGGKKLQINSTVRSAQEQMELWQRYQNGGTVAAYPGTSKHEKGLAVDIQQGKGDSEAIRILNSHGLRQTVQGDEVHFEGAYNGGIFKGPKSGYWTKLHGTEGVFNERQMAAISNTITKSAIPGGGGVNTASSDFTDYIVAVIEKLDNLIDLQHTNNRTGEEHLRYAKTN